MVPERMKTMTSYPYRYFHSPRFREYDFGVGHAFHPIRQELTLDLAQRAGLLPAGALCPPEPAATSQLQLFHTPAYIRAVTEVGAGAPPSAYPFYGLGTPDNPVFSGMHDAAAVRVGATLAAVQGVTQGRFIHAVNFGGGLHHAGREKASGFCIYNDIAVGISWLRAHLDCRVAYVDLDAHHGDGVQWGFYDDPEVLTVSIHESGRFLFPGTGAIDEIGEGDARGTSVNIPVLPHTSSHSWLECFDVVVPDVLEAFRPDILITQHGCDAHRVDPLSHLTVSMQTLDQATRVLHNLAHELCGGRWIALGGGGYSVWQVVPRAWGLVWATMTDQKTPDGLPREWLAAWETQAPVTLPAHWYDTVDAAPFEDEGDAETDRRNRENRKTAADSRRVCLKYLTKKTGSRST